MALVAPRPTLHARSDEAKVVIYLQAPHAVQRCSHCVLFVVVRQAMKAHATGHATLQCTTWSPLSHPLGEPQVTSTNL